MSARVTITADVAQYITEIDKLKKKISEMSAEHRKVADETKRLEREAVKTWREAATPLEKYNRKLADLKANVDAGRISKEHFRTAVMNAEAEMRRAESSSTKLSTSVLSGAAGMAAGLLSVSSVVSGILQQFETWSQNMDELSTQTNKTMNEVTSLAALQGGDPQTRARVMAAINAGQGAATPGESANLVQAMQSATGSFEKGMEIAKEVFAAQRVGIPVNLGTEIATLALAQSQDPGNLLRSVFVAGQESLRDPAAVARGAPALTLFGDKSFGVAAVAQLAGAFGEEVKSYASQAGAGLSGVSPAKEFFEGEGLGESATQLDRLRLLSRKGIDTLEEMYEIGFKDKIQQMALINLVESIQSVEKIQSAVNAKSGDTGMFTSALSGIYQHLPERAAADAIAAQRANFEVSRSFSLDAQKREIRNREIVNQLERRGIRESYFGDLYDNEGQLNESAMYKASWAQWYIDNHPQFRALRMLGINVSSPDVRGAQAAGESASRPILESIDRNTRPRAVVPRAEAN